jgi:hypothetical protein
MSRAFAFLTAIGSAATFAGVWVATEPVPVVAAPIVVPSDAVEATSLSPPVRKPVVKAIATEPDTHVVRDFVGSGSERPRPATRRESSVFYSGCREVRAAGRAPLYRGQPGYRAGMDGDNDGIACEAYRS